MVQMVDLHTGEYLMAMLLFDFSGKRIFSSNVCLTFLLFCLRAVKQHVTKSADEMSLGCHTNEKHVKTRWKQKFFAGLFFLIFEEVCHWCLQRLENCCRL